MRAEVERCRVILDGMSGRARGDTVLSTDPLPPVMLAEMAEGALTDAQRLRLRVEIAPGTDCRAVPVPRWRKRSPCC